MKANNGRPSDFNVAPLPKKKLVLYLIMIAGALAMGKVVAMSGRGAVASPEFRLLGIIAAQIVLFAVPLFCGRLVSFTHLLYMSFVMRVRAYQKERMPEACGSG